MYQIPYAPFPLTQEGLREPKSHCGETLLHGDAIILIKAGHPGSRKPSDFIRVSPANCGTRFWTPPILRPSVT